MNSDVRQLLQKIHEAGYTTKKTGSNHYKLLGKDGVSAVLDPQTNVPIVFASSPSDWRWRSNAVATLIRANVFDKDPFGVNGESKRPKRNGKPTKRRDREARARVAKEISDDVLRRSNALREKFDALAEQYGGWRKTNSKDGFSINEYIRAAHYYADKSKLWPTDTNGHAVNEHSAETTLRNLKSGKANMGLRWLPTFESFMAFLFEDDGPEEAGIRLELIYEEMKAPKTADDGLVAEIVRPTPEQVIAEAEKPQRTSVVSDQPTLAEQVLWFMARGAEANERDRVLGLARRVRALEESQ